MITPTPQQLAASLADLAGGYQAEILGITPDPALGHHIAAMANRIRNRVRADDKRLAAFAPFTDASGYVWLSTMLHDFFGYAAAEHWSFERWLTELAQAMVMLPPVDLVDQAQAGEVVDRLREDGHRPIRIDPDAGLIVTRKPRS